MKVSRHDWLTPANFLSVCGLALTIIGSNQLTTYTGILLVCLGRWLDIVDGLVARRTHSSPLGALLDATFDKVAIVYLALAALVQLEYGRYFIILILFLNVLNGSFALIWLRRGHTIQPLKAGKHAMFYQVLSIIMIAIYSRVVSGGVSLHTGLLVFIPTLLVCLTALYFSWLAAWLYWQLFKSSAPPNHLG